MPEILQQAQNDDAERRARQHLFIKIAVAGIGALVLILALSLNDETSQPEPAPTAQVIKPIAVLSGEQSSSESLEEAAKRALRTSEEAAQIQSAVLAEQNALPPSTASAVAEESVDPTAPVLGVPMGSSAPRAGRGESSGRLVVGQAVRPAPARSSAAAAVAAAVSPRASVSAAMPAPPSYLVQVGVFANHGNAEELRNKLVAAGIPAQIESRVQLGPFASKQEAASAQQKLRALGLDSGLVVPRSGGK